MIQEDQNSTVVKVRNVSYHYSGGNGIDGISLELKKGDFAILVGKTGTGKTTIFRLISLELKPDSGEIALLNLRSGSLKRRKLPLWRRQMGIVFQDLRLLNDRHALDNVKLAAACERRLPGSPKERSLRAIGKVGISHKLYDRPELLSTGEQQRVAIARALVNEPFLLLADEPVSNLDTETSTGIIEALYKISKSGTAVFVATHQPERFEKYNPRVLCIENGTLGDRC